jgi:Fe-S-cluster containining protein
MTNPCTACGACCAAFRVDFHPGELAVPVTTQLLRMRGTDASPPRCAALSGEIGVSVSCTIYTARPSPCREFDTSHEACTRARARHGLPPLPNVLPG